MSPLPPALAAWRDSGRVVSVLGHDVFVVERGHEHVDTIVILHGFPTSGFDFAGVIDRLAERHRVIVHDHLGFGLSDKPERWSYSLIEQAEVALLVWRELGVTQAHVIAHDYGTSVATELVARRDRQLLPFELRSLTLGNGSVHLDLARLSWPQKVMRSPTLGPLFARVASERLFMNSLRKTFARRDALDDQALHEHWAALSHADGRLALPRISRYLDERVRFADRWIGALTRFDRPAHVLWGKRDPIAVTAIAERLAEEIPGARLTWLDHVGHYPMLEDPGAWVEAALAFLAGL